MIIMNENHIEIKERRSSLVAKGIIFLFLAVFSLSIALLPYILSVFKDNALAFHLSGGIAFCFFATMFVFLLFKECKPDSAIILNSHGFIDNKNIGANIEIEWTNVASVKLMGKKETPYLGITLENADLVMAHMKKPYIEEMRENIEEGLPHILLSQNEIRYPINELKDLFVKFTREARALKNDNPTKPKNNPFTTEDVLRAFGKLEPIKEETIEDAPVEAEEIRTTDVNNSVCEESVYQEQADSEAPQTSTEDAIKSIDSFYEMLLRQSESAKTETAKSDAETNAADQTTDESAKEAAVEETMTASPSEAESNDVQSVETDDSEELSEEIIELISKAKSSKISEIEKMLNEKDVPFSTARVNEDADIFSFEPPVNEETALVDDFKEIDLNDNECIISVDEKHDDMGDTKEFYPEIVHFDDI